MLSCKQQPQQQSAMLSCMQQPQQVFCVITYATTTATVTCVVTQATTTACLLSMCSHACNNSCDTSAGNDFLLCFITKINYCHLLLPAHPPTPPHRKYGSRHLYKHCVKSIHKLATNLVHHGTVTVHGKLSPTIIRLSVPLLPFLYTSRYLHTLYKSSFLLY